MADSTAQNSLGQLFVDIGIGGLGKTLKALNSVSASFLLAKKGAEEFTKPIVDFSKKGGAMITGLDKINAVTGISINQLQKLKVWSKLSNVDFGMFVNQLQTMQQNLLDIRLGQGDTRGWSLLGIDPNSLDYTKPQEALNAIKKRVLELDEAQGKLALSMLGFSPELLYAWKQQNDEVDNSLILTEKETEELRKQQKEWNELGVVWEQSMMKFLAQTPEVHEVLQTLSSTIKEVFQYISENKDDFHQLVKDLVWLIKNIIKIPKFLHKAAEVRGQVLGHLLYDEVGFSPYNSMYTNPNLKSVGQIKKEKRQAAQTRYENEMLANMGLSRVDSPDIPAIPKTNGIASSSIMNKTSNKTIYLYNTQNITGQDAVEIGDETMAQLQQAYNLAEYQFQPNL